MLAFGLRTSAHEIEGDVERLYIRVIGVVDEGASVLAVLHLQAHCHLFQMAHTLT